MSETAESEALRGGNGLEKKCVEYEGFSLSSRVSRNMENEKIVGSPCVVVVK